MIPGSVPLQLPYGRLLMRQVNQAPVGFNPPTKKPMMLYPAGANGAKPAPDFGSLRDLREPIPNFGSLRDIPGAMGKPQDNTPLGTPLNDAQLQTIIKFRAAIKAAQAKRSKRSKSSPNFKRLTNVQQKRLTQAAAIRSRLKSSNPSEVGPYLK